MSNKPLMHGLLSRFKPGASRLAAPASPVALVLGAALALASGALSPSASSQATFADPAFRAAWERSDGPVASGAITRPWVWGPAPGQALSEPFSGLPGNTHLVQYFDKGRMEINNPNGDKNDPFYVTNGLLAVELISGQMQTGLAAYEYRGPAPINLASDSDDPTAPTYQSFNGVASIPGAPNSRTADPAVGTTVRTAIDRQGKTQPWPQDHPDYGVRIAYYEKATGHNIPDVFWDYLNQQTTIMQDGQPAQGPLFYPWFAVTGYPISEPYWSYVKVAGTYTDVLIQAFQRRVLTYVPHLPSPFKVQMGNIGQHYYEWRYLNKGNPPNPGGPTPTSPALPPKLNVTIDSISYRKSITDLNGTYCTITNREQQAVSLNGWWLDSPKWNYVDRFYFPNGITLAPGATVRVHSGPGLNTDTDIYMGRTTIMWDQQPYDLAVLYDNFGREVDRYFPAAEVGVTPTPQGTPGSRPTPPTTVPTKGTPVKGTPTIGVPTPQSTSLATIGPTATSETVTPGPSPTRASSQTVTPTPTDTPEP